MKRYYIVIILYCILAFLFPAASAQITVSESTPEFRFDKIEYFHSNEGGGYRLTVTGTAIYSGTILLRVDSPGVKSVGWVDGAEKKIIAGKEYIFHTDLEFNTGLDANKEFTGRVMSIPTGFGTGSTQEFKYYLKDKNEDSGAIYHKLTIIPVYGGTYDRVDLIEVCVDYGSSKTKGYGEVNSLKLLEGTHRIYVENRGEYYSRYTSYTPYLISLHKDTVLYIPIETSPNFQYYAYEKDTNKNKELGSAQIIISIVLILIITLYFKKKKI